MKDTTKNALRVAEKLAEIASDRNLQEVEINGVMIDIYDVKKIFSNELEAENSKIKGLIIDTTSDLVTNFMYYDRKNCEDLQVGAIEKAIKDKIVTIDEIVEQFKSSLETTYIV